ncbi:MAG TPA: GNAT family N-acetyltransferase, partial [Chloroflexia bacterium]|nr:GNAT family N-acetyltransferase [Chloroflexia bacterium]
IAQLGLPYFSPESILLAFGPAGDVAGVCRTAINAEYSARHGAPVRHISQLAVVPEHPRRGLGRALLLEGTAWLRAHGQQTIELGVMADNDQTLDLYSRTGFTATKQVIVYQREP